jgi:hypothetical protein
MFGLFAITMTLWISLATHTYAAELPLFDAHIRYHHAAWESILPKEAIATLRTAGVVRALVSSTSDEGTQKLYEEAPDLVIPELRPYRKNGETGSWFRDESVLEYLQDRLNQHRYAAIGEFHVNGAHADLPVVRGLVQLAKQHGLMLHAHSDADAVERLFRQDPETRIIWAHAGYKKPPRVRELLRRHAHLWPEFSSRDELTVDGRLTPEWRETFLEFPERFMIGTDAHAPDRWSMIASNAAQVRDWLGELPQEIAERVAYKNGEALLYAVAQEPAVSPGPSSVP